MPKKDLIIRIIIAVLGTAAVVTAAYVIFPKSLLNNNTNTGTQSSDLKRFDSAQEFRDYLQAANELNGTAFGRSLDSVNAGEATSGNDSKISAPTVERQSGTNVQVAGIDEPDIVKTDGQRLYVSNEAQFFYDLDIPAIKPVAPTIEPSTGSGSSGSSAAAEPDKTTAGETAAPDRIAPEQIPNKTSILKAFPPETLAKLGVIEAAGEMLLIEKRLIIFTGQKIRTFDVTDAAKPTEGWSMNLAVNDRTSEVIAARLREGKLYLVTRTSIIQDTPCPVKPLSVGTSVLEIPCADIYHPIREVPTNATLTTLRVNPADGKIEQRVTMTGSYESTVVFMSDRNLFITNTSYGDLVAYQYRFYTEAASDIVPASVREKIRTLQTYNISQQSKLNELQVIMNAYEQTLTADERLKFQKDLANRQETYQRQHQRELESTTVSRISLDALTIATSGQVPGRPLNQFSLDEYENHLRIATTSGSNVFGSGSASVNDVYVLNADLGTVGSVLDLGKDERIYSVRFDRERGYIVTFKQIDPFYVLDLKNPSAPKKAGELKIPGFSSYLHTLTDTLVLGIGQEGAGMKLSLFDVSNPAAPTEVSKYTLTHSWSEAQINHHAFLHDPKHQIFFLPAGGNGFVFAYDQRKITLTHAVNEIQARRAVYINDYLYVISSDEVRVFDERNFKLPPKELSL